MQPLGTKVYLLKGFSPSDSFCTFFSESVLSNFKQFQWGVSWYWTYNNMSQPGPRLMTKRYSINGQKWFI